MHWTIAYLIQLADTYGYSLAEIERRAGIKANSITRWKNENRIPSLEKIDKCFNVLGHRLSIQPKEEDLLNC